MIKSFAHRGLEVFFTTGNKAEIKAAHADRLSLQLGRLNTALEAADMDLPGWGFCTVPSPARGHSVAVAPDCVLAFQFKGGDAYDVDYRAESRKAPQ
jgi:proteic killer suppression protein